MKKDRYDRLEAVFHEAAELEGAARREFLHRACKGDEDLREKVERLLAQDVEQFSARLDEELGGAGKREIGSIG